LSTEISDMPNGADFAGFVDELIQLDGGRIPSSLRTVLRGEREKVGRGPREQALVDNLESHWAEAEPVEFELKVDDKPDVIHGAAGGSRETFGRPGGKGGRGEPPARKARATGTKAKANAAAPKKVKPPEVDPERAEWIKQVAVERLGTKGDKGLLQVVLVAGVRHRAKEIYGDMTPREVLLVLKDLEKAGVVRHSAARWMIKGRLSW
jgi:hypothetical protein